MTEQIPVDGAHIDTGGHYGDPRAGGRKHAGSDYAKGMGAPILSRHEKTGKVTRRGTNLDRNSGFGYWLEITYTDGVKELLAHMRELGSPVGTVVTNRNVVGYQGMTGAATGPHTHAEIVIAGVRVNPELFYGNRLLPTPPTGSNLTLGSRGARVLTLQRGLNRVFPLYSKLVEDGIYGPLTRAVVIEFQRRSNITIDGIVGPQTLAQLARYSIHP